MTLAPGLSFSILGVTTENCQKWRVSIQVKGRKKSRANAERNAAMTFQRNDTQHNDVQHIV